MPEHPGFLRITHRLWATILAGLVAVAIGVLVVADAEPDLPAALPAALVAAVGVAAIVGVEVVDRTFAALPPADDRAALVDYRVRFWLQIALLEAPVLLSVALAFVLGPAWLVLPGILAAVVALVRIRPTRRRLRRFDAAWHAAGHDVSIERALGRVADD